jgi:hypothetical protein
LFALFDTGFGLHISQCVGQKRSEIIVFHSSYLFGGDGLAIGDGDFRAGFRKFSVSGPAFKRAVNQDRHKGALPRRHKSVKPPLNGAILPSLVLVASGNRQTPLPCFNLAIIVLIEAMSACPALGRFGYYIFRNIEIGVRLRPEAGLRRDNKIK